MNIGAAGTFVIRARITRAKLRAELARRLPFETTIAICNGRDVTKLIDSEPYSRERATPDVVRFISVLTRIAALDTGPADDVSAGAVRGSSRFLRGIAVSSSASIAVI